MVGIYRFANAVFVFVFVFVLVFPCFVDMESMRAVNADVGEIPEAFTNLQELRVLELEQNRLQVRFLANSLQ